MAFGMIRGVDGWWQQIVNFFGGYAVNLVSLTNASALPAWISATFIAMMILLLRRKRGKQTRLRAMFRALFPRRIWRHRSTRMDIGYYVANTTLFLWIAGFFLVTSHVVDLAVHGWLIAQWGTRMELGVPIAVYGTVMVLALYIVYEFAYFLDHYLSHKIRFLWEFHKVHHSAEVLTPLTLFRVHLVDSIVYYNITAVLMGTTQALVNYGFGKPVTQSLLLNYSPIVLAFYYLWGHLQHSELWVATTGVWGRPILSPAHHQIHHSNSREHFDRNFGHSTGIFDWMFGTLHVPSKQRQKLRFGVDGDAHLKRFTASTFVPFYHAARTLPRRKRRLAVPPNPEPMENPLAG